MIPLSLSLSVSRSAAIPREKSEIRYKTYCLQFGRRETWTRSSLEDSGVCRKEQAPLGNAGARSQSRAQEVQDETAH